MKVIKSGIILLLSALSLQTFAASQLEVNSLVKCAEGTTLSGAVADLNLTVGSAEVLTLSSAGNYMHIKDFTSSQPTITRFDNGNYAVCVTLTKKSGWLSAQK